MAVSRRSFLAACAATAIAPVAWLRQAPAAWDFASGGSWTVRWWHVPATPPQRLYFTRLQDPGVWPDEEPSYEGCVFRIESGELLVSPDSLARARALWPRARIVTARTAPSRPA